MKELCKLKKNELDSNFKKITHIVKKARFVCEKCARAAKEKRYLCHPVKIG